MANTGRDFFRNYKHFISFTENVYRVLPLPIRNLIYKVSYNDKLKALQRYFNIRESGAQIKDNVYLADSIIIKNAQNLIIGNNFSIHEFSYIDAAGGIEIGNNVSIAHNCSLISFEHSWTDENTPIKYNPTIFKPIKIGNDVWIGCGVRVLSGTIIQDRVVIAAGSIAKGTLESGFLYGGVPVRKLKKL